MSRRDFLKAAAGGAAGLGALAMLPSVSGFKIESSNPFQYFNQTTGANSSFEVTTDGNLTTNQIGTTSDKIQDIHTASLTTDRVNTVESVSDQRLEALHQANQIRANAGVPDSETVGPESGVTVGISDSNALSDDTNFNMTSESDVSTAAASGDGSEGNPYVIKDKILDNSESVVNGIRLADTDATYHVKFSNCKIFNYTSNQAYIETGNGSDYTDHSVTFENCLIYADASSTGRGLHLVNSNVIVKKCKFAGIADTSVRGIANQGSKLEVKNCIFDGSQHTWGKDAIINRRTLSRATTSPKITISHTTFDDSGIQDCFQSSNTPPDEAIFENVKIRNAERGVVDCSNIEIRYCDMEGTTDILAEFFDTKNIEIHHSVFKDNASDKRLVRFRNINNPCRDVEVHHCKFTDSNGDGVIEPLSTAGGIRIHFHHNWVTECTNDAYEIGQGTDFKIHHCVGDNVDQQIVDIYQGNNGAGTAATGEVHHIYGDTINDVPVIVTDADDVSIWAIFAKAPNDHGIHLQNGAGPTGSPDNCAVSGPVPRAANVGGDRVKVDNDAGNNNEVQYLGEDNTIRTPEATPQQTEIR